MNARQNVLDWLEHAAGQGLLDAADRRWIERLLPFVREEDPENQQTFTMAFTFAVSALCRACAEGSLCIPLNRDVLEKIGGDESALLAGRFLAGLEAGAFDKVIGTPESPAPLIRANGFLYLHRFYFAERMVADGLTARLKTDAGAVPDAALETILRETLVDQPLRAPDGNALELTPLQKEALRHALREPVFVLSGGPGTGKTTWTAAWLRAVLRLPGVTPDRVRLCAPTGRAARRLEESLRARLNLTDAAPVDAGAHEVPVTTLHSLLGYRAFEGTFARDAGDPIDADWILLDEASMADVFLVAALVRALRPGARLVLAGDPDQLPAVEAGSVLGALLPEKQGPQDDRPGPVPSVTLDRGHRAHGDLEALAQAVRAGDAEQVLASLGGPLAADAVFTDGPPVARVEPGDNPSATLESLLRAYARSAFGPSPSGEPAYASLLNRFRTLAREDESAALESLWKRASRTRVLAPLRRGPVSAGRANLLLRQELEPGWRRPGDGRGTGFHGAPILITRNDDRAGLSNGDVGLWLESGDGAAVYFPRPGLPGGWLRLPVPLLPAHELGFASTVHKSQGSEYDAVLLLLPEAGNRLLARETLYTALTRARRGAQVFGTEAAIREAVTQRLQRFTGLREWFQG